MGTIAWIIPGPVSGALARMPAPSHVAGVQGFFDLSTWRCAAVSAAVLLLARNLIPVQCSNQRTGRR
ncbi:hypothetical protein [Nonomuraea diastatica]|uniref:Uncharacterized protein n=1 Tax=Nonomuraea diastatica TaxID=1848329 RepID=A0A4R4X136_9ACTN|nr:hypothetical protein [Nonomuraea diastatica]TDD23841.1 hypothetical protein E1294_07510 [Nonomuraea diastatica]